MAKDKSKTKGKAEAEPKGKTKKGGGSSGEFAQASEAPNTGGDGWNFEHADNVGGLFLITPLREDSVETKKYGTAEVVVCDIVELNEKKPGKSELHTNVYVFGGWTKGALRGYIGERKVLARLGQDAAKSKSDRPAWVLEDYDDDDLAVAKAYLDSVDPFEQSGADKAKAKAKGKK